MTENNALVVKTEVMHKFLAAKDDDDWDWSYEDNSTYGSCD